MDELKDIDEIIKLIETQMENGVGHVNFDINENGITSINTVQECCTKDMACQIPTLHEGLDDKED